MVNRVYVEKRSPLDLQARNLLQECRSFLGIQGLKQVRIFLVYDVQDLSPELFQRSCQTIFSEPQVDEIYETLPDTHPDEQLCVEYLPGQFDQRADSAAQCIQMLSQGERPRVHSMTLYQFFGTLTDEDRRRLRSHLINPVEAREASPDPRTSLDMEFERPDHVATLEGFLDLDDDGLSALLSSLGLAMDLDDLRFCRDYFRTEQRNPTITEIRMIDTYWSDHCRHTTFLTHIDSASFEDPEVEKTWKQYLEVRKQTGDKKSICLMDLATLAAKSLKKQGKLSKLDESDEINACTVRMTIDVDGVPEKWLLLFKNETHNHPTEIEPFGGAATCIGGAIRDPLSGRAYVYSAMRVTGAADPLRSVEETLPGKLPQRRLTQTAAAGYSSYGNQIGLATGQVSELYHPGYAAKRLEIGAVVAAAPEKAVRREVPQPGDVVVLLGGATGRDGCGGATGSSKSHTAHSLETCGAEVQKGNAPEERKLQRLFRNQEATRLIKRCNDFGAGGVSVAIGELADGLDINLDLVPKKYEGLDGTELAISESQERMAVVLAKEDLERFLELSHQENLQATAVAHVTAEPRLRMHWQGQTIVDVSRDFLNSNGAEKHIQVKTRPDGCYAPAVPAGFSAGVRELCRDLNVCSQRGLSERFDSTIGSGTVLMPFGGVNQLTPIQAMVQKVSLENGHTDACTYMAWGYNPYLMEAQPYRGAYLSVVESVARLIATGASAEDVYLTFQEYFPHPGHDPRRWGDPLSALLGAFRAQLDLGMAAIGGKDSMSGTFENLDVPPTLVSFAITTGTTDEVLSCEWKEAGHSVVLLRPRMQEGGLPEPESLLSLFHTVHEAITSGRARAVLVPGMGGIAAACLKSAFGNGIGVNFQEDVSLETLFGFAGPCFLMEVTEPMPGEEIIGCTAAGEMARGGEHLELNALLADWEATLEPVFPVNVPGNAEEVPTLSHEATSFPAPHVRCAKPKMLIPVFPGTNCEYDSLRTARDQGWDGEILVIRNLSRQDVELSSQAFAEKVRTCQAVFLPGGFSGGDEPDGSGKFITAFLRGEGPRAAITELLEERDGLMLGICNGFQALIKLGLVPYGRIMDTDRHCPTLSFNTIGRHQSRLVYTRVASNLSPWLRHTKVGETFLVPISHGEGRFLAEEDVLKSLTENGQIATQYVNLDGRATLDIHFNPNGSLLAVEGITSPDGRVLGKMGHSERIGKGLYKNVPGNTDMQLFRAGLEYFTTVK